jgi:3-isopropylmalate/(R)-2-methylmalate dehydratase small subunit
MKLRGRVWNFGSVELKAVDILPTKYDNPFHRGMLDMCIRGLMEDIDPAFARNFKEGDLIVGGLQFGAGHAHYVSTALGTLKASGLGGVVANSASWGMVQKAIDSGFPIVEYPGIVDMVETGEELEFDLATGEATNVSRGTRQTVKPLPEMVLGILEQGGFAKYALRRLGKDVSKGSEIVEQTI